MRYSNRITLVTLFLVLFALVACQPAQAPEAARVITIKTTDYAFEAPEQIQAGLVSINLENAGQEPHHVQLVRLNDDVTVEQFQVALQQSPEAALPLVTFGGGPGVVSPGKSQQVTVKLEEGRYFLLCFVPDREGLPHLAHGMIKPLEVVSGSGTVQASEPQADSTIAMNDFAFQLPVEIKAGQQVWKVTNEGKQPHELALIKLADGKTMQDVAAFFEAPNGPPPFEDAGGLQAIDPGESGWMSLDLEPASYVALCYVPDPASGKEHLELGMVSLFQVN